MPAPKNTGSHRKRRSSSAAKQSASAPNIGKRGSKIEPPRPPGITASVIASPPLAQNEPSGTENRFTVVFRGSGAGCELRLVQPSESRTQADHAIHTASATAIAQPRIPRDERGRQVATGDRRRDEVIWRGASRDDASR